VTGLVVETTLPQLKRGVIPVERKREESIMGKLPLLVLVAFAVGATCLFAAEEKIT
jgi:hypothetical protein